MAHSSRSHYNKMIAANICLIIIIISSFIGSILCIKWVEKDEWFTSPLVVQLIIFIGILITTIILLFKDNHIHV